MLTLINVLDVNVGEMRLHLLDLAHPLLFADMVSDVNLLVVQQHSIDGLDGGIGSFSRFVVNESVSPRSTILIDSDFAREDVSESGKGVVEGLQNTQTRSKH